MGEVKSYFQHEPQERAKFDDAQIDHFIALELMISGVVKPTPPRARKQPEDVVLRRENVYRITNGHSDLPIAFRSEAQAEAFLAMTPVFVTTDWGTRTEHYEPMQASLKIEALPNKEAVKEKSAELEAVAKESVAVAQRVERSKQVS